MRPRDPKVLHSTGQKKKKQYRAGYSLQVNSLADLLLLLCLHVLHSFAYYVIFCGWILHLRTVHSNLVLDREIAHY